ncbi:MAG: hypothetical protein QOD39_4593 [Mycobacterium sp.]|nr:hypothetical protein [Mycobacterium sp.]
MAWHGGRQLSDEEINDIREAWTPIEVADRLSSVAAPWYVAAGWALDAGVGKSPPDVAT